MTTDSCQGCGRAIGPEQVSCPGCGRPLHRGSAVPPGWEVTVTAESTIPGAPRWRLAGIDTARPLEMAEETTPHMPPEVFRPRPEDTVDLDPAAARRSGWRVRERQPRPLTWTPAVATAAATTTGVASRMVFWALVGGILATSSAAVLLLTLHLLWGR